MRRALALIGILMCTTLALAKKPDKPEHMPLPAKVLTAKTIYIDNETGWQQAADSAYTALKMWGKFQIVDAKEKADLILVVQFFTQQVNSDSPSWVSTYNSKTGAWTNGTVTSPSTSTLWSTQLSLVDPATGEIAWVDRRVWRKKQSATLNLIESLRQRVEEQERQAAATNRQDGEKK